MSVDVTEESIIDALHRVPRESWNRVLEFLHQREPLAGGLPPEAAGPDHWTAAELLAMTPSRRDSILEAAAAMAEADYRDNTGLTDFEAFSPDDLYVDDAPTR